MIIPAILSVFFVVSRAQVPSSSTGSCQNFTSCCDPAVYSSCFGTTGDCYCDQICYEFNDCCSDIGDNCLAASNEPTADTGSCLNVGYDGCCNPNTHVTCKGDDDICYCDQVCFQYGDCCSDIHQIGCYINANSPVASSTEGSCASAGFESCCNPSDSANCYGNPPTCYCDAACFDFNDCCSDISQICIVETPTASQGSCAGLGFTDGCCTVTSSQNCHGTDGTCYCDQACYNFGDCCGDIEEINCLNVQSTGEQGSCALKGFEGCCDPNLSSGCYGSAGTSCYCDELCYQFGDCCFDIAQIGCLEPSTAPVKNNGSCLLAGHFSCCSVTAFEPCLGSDGSCHCDANCYNYGDCCKDIAYLLCTKPTNVNQGSCKAAGYTECCHPYNQQGTSCYGDPQTCYCDALCFNFGDCCDDVTSIGCIAPTGDVTPNQGSCADAGYKTCCVPSSNDPDCVGYPETCHCDEICHEYGDCCSDVIDIGCSAQKGSCAAAGHTSCCLSDDPTCTGMPANCFCDQGCFSRGDCCSDIGTLQNCGTASDKIPGPVNSLTITPSSDTSFTVTWNPPDFANGANIYFVKVNNYTATPNDHELEFVIPVSTQQKVVTDLKPYTPYNVTVYAVNEYGPGYQTVKSGFSKETTPDVSPHNVKVVRSDKNTITVTWSPLNLTEARGFVTGYQITYFSMSRRRRSTSNDEKSTTVDGTKTTVSISGLDALKKYGVKVAGMTKAGVGKNSKVSYESGSNKGSGPSTNYALIIGITLGVFGLVLLSLAIIFVVVLVFLKKRSKASPSVSGKAYTRLLVNSTDDDDDDEDMVD